MRGCSAARAACVHLWNSVVFVCGRLFELDPELLSLFQYTTNCGSTQDCLSSPEFLEHVTKVSSAEAALAPYAISAEHRSVIPGDARDRCCRQPPGRPSLPGGLFAQPGAKASGSGSQPAVVCRMSHILQLVRHLHIFFYINKEKKHCFIPVCLFVLGFFIDCG